MKKGADQGCQMVCFQTKNPNFGKLWRVLQWKMMVYFIDTRSISRSFVIFYGHLVVYFPVLVFCTKKNLATLAQIRTAKKALFVMNNSFAPPSSLSDIFMEPTIHHLYHPSHHYST
jgi:hypothetical protein